MTRWRPVDLALLAVLSLPALVAEPQIPERFENLQVLPPDIPRRQLVETMKGFTRALGVRCQHCHVGEGDDLSTYDFASDARPEKASARVMIEMVRAINHEHLSRLTGGEAEDAAAAVAVVTCVTCHRGEPEPRVEEEPAPADAAAPPEGVAAADR